MIQEVLGHSDFQTTADIYAHVVEAMRDEATKAMDDIFDSKKNPVVAPVVAFVVSETIQMSCNVNHAIRLSRMWKENGHTA